MMDETTAHMASPGSNDLIGRNIRQSMTFTTPDVYETMQASHAGTGRRDLVRLRYVAGFKPTVGRNLGIRHRGQVEHGLLVIRLAFELLATRSAEVLTHARCGIHRSQR